MKTPDLAVLAFIAMILSSTNLSARCGTEFSQFAHGLGTKIICKRDGVVIYEYIQMNKFGQSHYSLYTFFWKKKVAATVLTIGNRTTIQQSARLPVSFAIDLDESYRPAIGYV